MTDPIAVAYNVVATIGAFVAMYLMQQSRHDPIICKTEPKIIQEMRSATFILGALALLYSVQAEWTRSLAVLGLVSAWTLVILVNAVALHLRNRPKHKVSRQFRNSWPAE